MCWVYVASGVCGVWKTLIPGFLSSHLMVIFHFCEFRGVGGALPAVRWKSWALDLDLENTELKLIAINTTSVTY